MIKIKTQVFYLPILYRYITTYTSSPAQLHSELVRYSPPTRNSAKVGFYAFSTSKKKSSGAVCETVLVSNNH